MIHVHIPALPAAANELQFDVKDPKRLRWFAGGFGGNPEGMTSTSVVAVVSATVLIVGLLVAVRRTRASRPRQNH